MTPDQEPHDSVEGSVPSDLVGRDEKLPDTIARVSRGDIDKLHISKLVMDSIDSLELLYNREGQVTGLSTGFKELDELVGGMSPGQLIVIASPPDTGKRAFTLNLAEHVALNLKKPIAYFNTSGSSKQLTLELMASRAELDLRSVSHGFLGKGDSDKLTSAAAELCTSKLHIDDSAHLSIGDLRARLQVIKECQGLELIIVDNLRLLKSGPQGAASPDYLENAAKDLKSLAVEFSVPLLLIYQLSPTVASECDGYANNALLQDHREIIEGADLFMVLEPDLMEDFFLNQESYVHLHVMKNSAGFTKTLPMRYHSLFRRFRQFALDDL